MLNNIDLNLWMWIKDADLKEEKKTHKKKKKKHTKKKKKNTNKYIYI